MTATITFSCSPRHSTRCRAGGCVGDYAPYLDRNMDVADAVLRGPPISIEIPQRATFESGGDRTGDEGSDASGSFKPAKLSNGGAHMVPTHIVVGTRIVVMTEDGSYIERAKD